MLPEISKIGEDYTTISSFDNGKYPVKYIGSAAYHFTSIIAQNIKITDGVQALGIYAFDARTFKKYCVTLAMILVYSNEDVIPTAYKIPIIVISSSSLPLTSLKVLSPLVTGVITSLIIFGVNNEPVTFEIDVKINKINTAINSFL
jgi:hypothetical protein